MWWKIMIPDYMPRAVVWAAKMLKEIVSWCASSPRIYTVTYLNIDVQRKVGKSYE
jgi:hypothetical protein